MTEDVAWRRIPVIVSFANMAKQAETYGFAGNSGKVNLEGQLLRSDAPSSTIFILMHPTSILQLLPIPMAMASAGMHVLCAASRYPRNDSALIMENAVIDMGKWIEYSRAELGYQKVVLLGWSGGGSLALFYQAQAENPTITHTPAGDPLDLKEAALIPADGVIFVAAHLSRAETLTEWLDPSVIDERNPDLRDLNLDIYASDAMARPPYSPAFIAAFRTAQRSRNRKITDWCLEKLDDLKRGKSFEHERGFVVHRTMCDVRWFDTTIDPNDRKIGWSYMGDPRAVNVGPVGLARFCTLRSWLSQWSYDLSNAKGSINAALIRQTPVLQIENTADDAVPATHNPIIAAALATQDKEYIKIKDANHYYIGQPELLKKCIDTILEWCYQRNFLS